VFAKLRKRPLGLSYLSIPPTICMENVGSHWTGFHEILCWSILRKSVEKIQDILKSDNNAATLHEDLCTFMIISYRILLWVRNLLDKIY